MNTMEMTEMLQSGVIRNVRWDAMTLQVARLCWPTLPEHPTSLHLIQNDYGSSSCNGNSDNSYHYNSVSARKEFGALLRILLWTPARKNNSTTSGCGTIQALHIEERNLYTLLPELATVTVSERSVVQSASFELYLNFDNRNDGDPHNNTNTADAAASSNGATTAAATAAAAASALETIAAQLSSLSHSQQQQQQKQQQHYQSTIVPKPKLVIRFPSSSSFPFSQPQQESPSLTLPSCCFPVRVLYALAKGLQHQRHHHNYQQQQENHKTESNTVIQTNPTSSPSRVVVPEIIFRNVHLTQRQFIEFCECMRRGVSYGSGSASTASRMQQQKQQQQQSPCFGDILTSLSIHFDSNALIRHTGDRTSLRVYLELLANSNANANNSIMSDGPWMAFLQQEQQDHHGNNNSNNIAISKTALFANALAVLLESSSTRLQNLEIGHFVLHESNSTPRDHLIVALIHQTFGRIRQALIRHASLQRLSVASVRGFWATTFWIEAIFPALVVGYNSSSSNDKNSSNLPNSPSCSGLHSLEMPALHTTSVIRAFLQLLPRMQKLRHVVTSGRTQLFAGMWRETLERNSIMSMPSSSLSRDQPSDGSPSSSLYFPEELHGLINLNVDFILGAFGPPPECEHVQALLRRNRFLLAAYALLKDSSGIAITSNTDESVQHLVARETETSNGEQGAPMDHLDHTVRQLAEFGEYDEGLSAAYIVVRGTLSLFC